MSSVDFPIGLTLQGCYHSIFTTCMPMGRSFKIITRFSHVKMLFLDEDFFYVVHSCQLLILLQFPCCMIFKLQFPQPRNQKKICASFQKFLALTASEKEKTKVTQMCSKTSEAKRQIKLNTICLKIITFQLLTYYFCLCHAQFISFAWLRY